MSKWINWGDFWHGNRQLLLQPVRRTLFFMLAIRGISSDCFLQFQCPCWLHLLLHPLWLTLSVSHSVSGLFRLLIRFGVSILIPDSSLTREHWAFGSIPFTLTAKPVMLVVPRSLAGCGVQSPKLVRRELRSKSWLSKGCLTVMGPTGELYLGLLQPIYTQYLNPL